MALSFPLSAANFFSLIRIASARFWLPDTTTFETSEGGEVFTADRGPRLWQAEFTLAPNKHDVVDQTESRLALLAQAGRSFFAYDPRRTGPQDDPTGATLGASTPTITAIGTRELTISGLPASYKISRGDYIGWTYGSSPTRYALHRAVDNVTATGGGVAADIEVTPGIRPGTTIGASVSLIRPQCKMVLVPGSYSPGTGQGIATGGASFRAIQTLR